MKRSRLNPFNRKRRKRLHARNFGAYADVIRGMRCVGCGKRPPSDAAHSEGRKMGGYGGDRKTLVPLCRSDPQTGWVGCHYLFDEDFTGFMDRTWLSREDVRMIAAELWRTHGGEDDGSEEQDAALREHEDPGQPDGE